MVITCAPRGASPPRPGANPQLDKRTIRMMSEVIESNAQSDLAALDAVLEKIDSAPQQGGAVRRLRARLATNRASMAANHQSLEHDCAEVMAYFEQQVREGCASTFAYTIAAMANEGELDRVLQNFTNEHARLSSEGSYVMCMLQAAVDKFAPEHVAEKRRLALEALRKLPCLHGPVNARGVATKNQPRAREGHRAARTARAMHAATAASSSSSSSGSSPPGSSARSGPTRPAPSDDPDPPERPRVAIGTSWRAAGNSSTLTDASISFTDVKS